MPQNSSSNTSIFQRPIWVSLFALTAAVVWGWAYPLIKLGYEELEITSQMTSAKMLFAGIRFAISGAIILLVAWIITKRSLSNPHNAQVGREYDKPQTVRQRFLPRKALDWYFILLFTLLNTTLHYACFYLGLSNSAGARAAILNSLSVFTVVILACVFFKSDHMDMRKIVGCIIGFTGILILNIGAESSGQFTLQGDGLIICNALCGAFASLMTRGVSKRIDVFIGTGYSLGIGGVLLLVPAWFAGGRLPNVTLYGMIILALLIAISTIGFTLYNKLLSMNPVGKVAIYNSLIPVVGAITSCACLGETFYWNYVVAGALAAGGIFIINKGK